MTTKRMKDVVEVKMGKVLGGCIAAPGFGNSPFLFHTVEATIADCVPACWK